MHKLISLSSLLVASLFAGSFSAVLHAQVLVEKPKTETHTGELQGVEGRTITVGLSPEKTVATKVVGEKCVILLNSEPAKLSDLQKGDILRMTLSTANPREITKLTAARVVKDTPPSTDTPRTAKPNGSNTEPARPAVALGVRVSDSPGQGILVVAIEKDSPAEASRLLVGDYIMKVEQKVIDTPESFLANIGKRSDRSRVTLKLWREGVMRDADVMLVSSRLFVDQHVKEPRLLLHNAVNPQQKPGFVSPYPKEKWTTYYGLTLYPDKEHGPIVVEVSPKSYLAMGNLQHGDQVLEIDSRKVDTPLDIYKILHDLPLDREVEILVVRDGKSVKSHFKTSAY